MNVDLLICGGDESGCAAAVQAARMGVKRIALMKDIDWLGGQFCTQGIRPMDEWTLVNGKTVNFPRSGAFLEIMRQHSSTQSPDLWNRHAWQRMVRHGDHRTHRCCQDF